MHSINEKYNQAFAILKEHYEALNKIDNVIATGIGFRLKNNQYSKEVCIYAVVRKKIHIDKLDNDQIIPKNIDGIPIDVVERKEKVLFTLKMDPSQLPKTTLDGPIKGGIAISNYIPEDEKVEVGTLGALVQVPISTSGPFNALLSNEHVIYAKNAQNGHPIYTYNPKEKIARNCKAARDVDGGLAKMDATIELSNEVIDIGPLQGWAHAQLGETVRKYGSTTKLTYGFINKIELVLNGSELVITQLEILPLDPNQPFGDHGDSGAVVVNDDNKVVGLFWGTYRNKRGEVYANGIDEVRNALLDFVIPIPDIEA